MSLPNDFFADFPPVSKQQWLDRIARDLKGKPLEDLKWHLNEAITVDPFVHADDLGGQLPAPFRASPPGWEINEDVAAGAPDTANRQALEALAFGAESLHFQLVQPDITGEIEQLFQRIHLDYISLNFSGRGLASGPAAVLSALSNLTAQQGLSTQDLRGSLYYDPAAGAGPIQDWRYLTDLLAYARAEYPGMRCLSVDARTEFRGTAGTASELSSALRRGAYYLTQLADRGVPAEQVSGQLQFSFFVGKSYFVEMAKLRAFQLLWFNVLKAFGAPVQMPVLDIRFSPDAYSDDLYANMIGATTMAMSAVLGGANRLTVLPYDAGREEKSQYPQAFGRRIARNVQHLLKLESGFDQLVDPVSGSYYLEKLTAQLAEEAWEQLGQQG